MGKSNKLSICFHQFGQVTDREIQFYKNTEGLSNASQAIDTPQYFYKLNLNSSEVPPYRRAN